MSNKKVIRLVLMFLSAIIIGLGISFFVNAKLGADAMTTFEEGLSNTLHLDLSICLIIANGIFVLLTLLIDRKSLHLTTLVYPLFISLGIKISSLFVPSLDNIVIRVFFMLLALIIIGMGIGLAVVCDSGNNPYDGFVVSLSGITKIQFRYVRAVCDLVVLAFGVLLKGSFGIGTFVAILLQGTVGQFFIEFFSKNKTINNLTK